MPTRQKGYDMIWVANHQAQVGRPPDFGRLCGAIRQPILAPRWTWSSNWRHPCLQNCLSIFNKGKLLHRVTIKHPIIAPFSNRAMQQTRVRITGSRVGHNGTLRSHYRGAFFREIPSFVVWR